MAGPTMDREVLGVMRRQALLCLSLLFGLALAAPAEARPRCGGKKATIVGGPGDNVIRAPKHGRQVIVGGRGRDRIYARPGRDIVCGGPGNDRIFGGTGRDKIFGGTGNDHIDLGPGRDKGRGGGGNDAILGAAGGDRINGGPGRDRMFGGIQDDVVAGGGGPDLVVGGHGIDRLRGNGGGDWLRGDTNSDRYDGGPGSDTLSFATATPPGPFGLDGVIVNLRTGSASGDDANERVRRIENLVGSPFDDRLTGRGGGFVRGGLGRDSCSGFSSEACSGQTGGNSFAQIADRDSPDPGLVIMGGPPGDNWTISGRSTVLRISGSQLGAGTGCRRSGGDLICTSPRPIGYVLAWGGNGGDRIAARGLPRAAVIKFDGGLGDDRLLGGNTTDLLYAGEGGSDLLRGGAGDDALVSRAGGGDRLFGGRGNDQLVTDSPCDGHLFAGGAGGADVAGFGHVQRRGVKARIGGKGKLRGVRRCNPTRIRGSSEVLEGTRFRDVLIASGRNDLLIGRAGRDRCVGGRHKRC